MKEYNESDYPVEPWELRAYVEEDPSLEYDPGNASECIVGRYCNERLGPNGYWEQGVTTLTGHGDMKERRVFLNPPWVTVLVDQFDSKFADRVAVTGKEILEAGILPTDEGEDT